jgi:DNA-binding transcriptional LysR family regulator
MRSENLDDLATLIVVAEERSFTRAAARLAVSQSALSQTIRGLEARLGIRLLNRTTRSVSPTPAGERLLQTVSPRVKEIEAALAAVSELRETPAGTIRLTATENAAEAVLWPALRTLLPNYPDIKVEVIIDYGLTDIVAEQVDAGVRPGETVAKDMIAVPIGPAMRMAVVGSPSYLAKHPPPRTPRDLTDHDCLNLRLPARRGIYAWEFERNGRELKVRVDGPLVFNTATLIVHAALDGFGLAYLTEQQVKEHLDSGVLVRVLANWCPPFAGYHLYYPSRRQPSAAFAVLVEALRYRPAPCVQKS